MFKIVTTIFYNDDNKILLAKRANKDFFGCYGLTGGKVKDNEDVKEANIREHKEELGINIKSNNFLKSFTFDKPALAEVFVYYEKFGDWDLSPDKKEIAEYDFFGKEEIGTLKLAPNHKEVIEYFFDNVL